MSACSRRSRTMWGGTDLLQSLLHGPCVPVHADPDAECRREGADALVRLAADEHEVRRPPRQVVDGLAQERSRARVDVGADELGHVAEDHVDGGIRVEDLDLAFDLVGTKAVVRVEEGEVVTRRQLDRAVSRGAHARVLLPLVAQRRAEAPRDVAAGVGRAVVEDDQLDGGVGLREDALDRLGQVRRAVEHGDHHRDEPLVRRGGCHRLSRSSFSRIVLRSGCCSGGKSVALPPCRRLRSTTSDSTSICTPCSRIRTNRFWNSQ